MITREKLLQTKPASWHIFLLVASVIMFLATGASLLYWFIFHNNPLFAEKKPQPQAPGTYVYPRYKLNNVIKQKVFGPSVDVSR